MVSIQRQPEYRWKLTGMRTGDGQHFTESQLAFFSRPQHHTPMHLDGHCVLMALSFHLLVTTTGGLDASLLSVLLVVEDGPR